MIPGSPGKPTLPTEPMSPWKEKQHTYNQNHIIYRNIFQQTTLLAEHKNVKTDLCQVKPFVREALTITPGTPDGPGAPTSP